jgi:hypothetical protein
LLDDAPGKSGQMPGLLSWKFWTHWDWYFKELLGCGHFVSNTWKPTSANLDVEDMTHPVSQGLGATFTSAPNEWYSWEVDLRTKSNIKILLSIAPSSSPSADPSQSWYEGYYPVVWTNTNDKMMYVNMGHNQMDYGQNKTRSFTFSSDTQNRMLLNAIHWLGGATANN